MVKNFLKYKAVSVSWVLLFFILPWGGFGQENGAARRISPDEAVELALRNNLGLESSRLGVEGRKRKSDLSWNSFTPGIGVTGSMSRDNEAAATTALNPSPPPWTVSVEAPQWHIAGTLQVQLAVSAAMLEDMRTLRLEYESGLISYEAARAQLERNVRKSYYQILLAGENVKLLREQFAKADRQVTMARENYLAGLAPELSVLQAQVARENLRPAIDQAENSLKTAQAQFAVNLGLEYDTRFEFIPVETEPDFIPLDVAELISRAASESPDILVLKQDILALQSRRRALSLRNFTPGLSLSWNTTQAFTQDPWKTGWFGNGDNWRQSGSFTVALNFSFHNLFPFSPAYQGVRDMDDNLRVSNIGLAQKIRQTELEIFNTVLSLERTRISAEAQSLTIAMAEQAYSLTEQAYRAGLQDFLEVQNAELSLHQARVQMLEQNFNYRIGLIDLEYAIGVPFGTLSSQGSK
jgi:outer membrane protein TolC